MVRRQEAALEGVHFVAYRKADGRRRWYVYAWRGGPKIMDATGEAKPALTPEAVAAYTEAHLDRSKPRKDTFGQLVTAYLGSREYLDLADTTRGDYRQWADRAREEFGDTRLKLFGDPRMRGVIIDWRDKWKGRTAQYATQVLRRIFSWGVARGWLLHNPAAGMESTYSADRADIIWTDDEIEAVAAEMSAPAARAFRLAAWTGLARGDLVSLKWSEVHEHHIEHARRKTGVEQIVPLFDETRTILAECPRTPAGTVCTNRWGRVFTVRAFSQAVERARKAAKVVKGKTLHDLRGTFATRLMQRGFEDREIDEIMGWETGKSARIRRRYISRKAIVESAIKRMRSRDGL